jgi:hypothetical protein
MPHSNALETYLFFMYCAEGVAMAISLENVVMGVDRVCSVTVEILMKM